MIESANAFRENNNALVESNEVQSEYQNSLSELGKIFMPIITDITEAITFLIDGFNNLPGPAQTIITVIIGFIAVLAMLSPVLFSISTLMSTVGASALFANVSMLPLIATILSVGAVLTALILIFQNWEDIVNWFSNTWDNIKGAFLDFGEQISDFFSGLIESAVEWGSDMIDGFVKGIKKLLVKLLMQLKE